MTSRVLAIVERHPGDGGGIFADPVDFCVGLRTGLGAVDMVLCGPAVMCALGLSPSGDGSGALLDSARRVRTLLRTGSRVWVDRDDLAASGHTDDALLDGVVTADIAELATSWHEYDKVWFL